MENKIVKSIIQFRKDTSQNWELNKNCIPRAGEPCFCTDTGMLKIGNGIDTYENLPFTNIPPDTINNISNEISDIKELIGEQSISQQINDAINAIHIEDICKINSISMGNNLLNIINKTVEIPIATQLEIGVVKGSDEIAVSENGTMSINKVNINKIVQDENDFITLNSGNSNSF